MAIDREMEKKGENKTKKQKEKLGEKINREKLNIRIEEGKKDRMSKREKAIFSNVDSRADHL